MAPTSSGGEGGKPGGNSGEPGAISGEPGGISGEPGAVAGAGNDTDAPPFPRRFRLLGSWRNLHLLVLAWLAICIALFTLLSWTYR